MNNILFVTHKKSQCGVYEFGENIFNVVKQSAKYNFAKVECENLEELLEGILRFNPGLIIYNYMPSTMPWLSKDILKGKVLKNNISDIPILQVGIIHSILQDIADSSTQGSKYSKNFHCFEIANSFFDFYIAPDPTLLLKNPFVFKHGRPIPEYINKYALPRKITIGSFGFAKKGYDDLINLVQGQLDDVEIKLHIPFAKFGDENGSAAYDIAEHCRSLIKKPSVKLTITHDYLDKEGILDFLAQNTINLFLRDNEGRGISSVIDYALAVGRPIGISDSRMFRHIKDANPSIMVEKMPLIEIIENGLNPLERFRNDWSTENLIWEYERIIGAILKKNKPYRIVEKSIFKALKYKLANQIKLPLLAFKEITPEVNIVRSNNWLGTTDYLYEDNYKSVSKETQYTPIKNTAGFNRILDNSARELYKPTVEHLSKLLPKTMEKKIPEANVQQAFVFDTVYRNLANYRNPKILSVGSYEDTASMALVKMGISVEEIDPMFNYFLQEYATKPDQKKHSYDIIFSTSVIEHDPNDQSFMESISDLLAPNGLLVMTCDFKEGWQKDDVKPAVCERLYTKKDLTNRLISYMENSNFIDEPNWDCPNPDFFLGGIYNYTFATFVVKKES